MFFSHGLKRVIKFVFLNVHALLACFFQFFKHLLCFIDVTSVPFEPYPALAGGHLHTKGVLEVLQEFNVIRVERLQSAWALKLQSARFSHFLAGIGICADRLTESQCH